MPLTNILLLTPFLTGTNVSAGSPGVRTPGKKVLKDIRISISGRDVSAYANKATVHVESQSVDVTCIGDKENVYIAGLMTITFDIKLFSGDWILDKILWDAKESGGTVPLVIKPDSKSTISWGADCVVLSYSPFGGSVGAASMIDLTLTASDEPVFT